MRPIAAKCRALRARASIIAILLLAAGCGDDEPATPSTVTVQIPPDDATTTSTTERGQGQTAQPDKPSGPAEGAEADPRETELERTAARTARAYVAAIDARDGERLCGLLAPGGIDELALPVNRGGCAASVAASIGYRDPRGLPVWNHGKVSAIRSVELEGSTAKLVVTVVTRFADRDELSIEDDVVYLERSGRRWLIAKPSSTLYRAVGVADVPPSVLAPPG
jgi:hypothetical protein